MTRSAREQELEAALADSQKRLGEYEAALMRIGEELGLAEVTAFNCVDAIRVLKGLDTRPR